MTHPLMYLVPIVVGVGAFIFLTLTNQRERQNSHEQRRKQYQPEKEYDAPENGTCTICLETYDPWMLTEKTRCGHVFHLNCYRRLLENSGIAPACPNCKRPVF